MISEVRVGPQKNTDGATTVVRGGRTGEVCVGRAHGQYAEAVTRGNVFCAANQVEAGFTAIATTAAVGFGLINPAGSGKNLVILEIIYMSTASISNSGSIMLGTNLSTTAGIITFTTTLVARNALLGSRNVAVGIPSNQYTQLATNVFIRPLVGFTWGGGAVVGMTKIKEETAGSIILSPGSMLGLYRLTSLATGAASVTWEEVPV